MGMKVEGLTRLWAPQAGVCFFVFADGVESNASRFARPRVNSLVGVNRLGDVAVCLILESVSE
jgi:hypothetical protein